ncbi:MAG: hypothetical protein WDN46_20900 [Methylocella sp.]
MNDLTPDVDDGADIVDSYRGIVCAIRDRRKELGLVSLEIEEIAGLQQGYLAKIEAGMKGLGPLSLDSLLPALGLKFQVVKCLPYPATQRVIAYTAPSDIARRRKVWDALQMTPEERKAKEDAKKEKRAAAAAARAEAWAEARAKKLADDIEARRMRMGSRERESFDMYRRRLARRNAAEKAKRATIAVSTVDSRVS